MGGARANVLVLVAAAVFATADAMHTTPEEALEETYENNPHLPNTKKYLQGYADGTLDRAKMADDPRVKYMWWQVVNSGVLEVMALEQE